MADIKQTTTDMKAAPALPPAPWEHLYDGVSRLKVPGGYIYDVHGKGLCFTPGAA